MDGATLAHLAWGRAGERPDDDAYVLVRDGDLDEVALGWSALDRRARAVAAAVLRAGVARGARALLLLPHGLDFPCALLGCFYAGVVAVPTNPPGAGRRPLERTAAIARDAELCLVLATAELCAQRDALVARAPELGALPWIAVDALADADALARDALRLPRPDELAFLQYTSGSTGTPRGVMVTHANALHNVERLRQCLHVEREAVLVSWLPFHHDMGLVGMLLSTLYTGPRCVLLSPVHFLERPLRWLQALARHRGTMSGAPDFAFELCAQRAAAEPDLVRALDLASVRRLFSGSEPIRAQSLRRFLDAFAACGLSPDALVPGYGLAEATLVVSASTRMVGARVFALERAALDAGRAVAWRDAPGAAPARELVGCGPPLPGVEVAIVDPASARRVGEGTVGEVWVRGPSVARGYWRDDAATRAAFDARLADARPDEAPRGWLRTGDLGLLREGELCLTGRLKDLLIVRGENRYPQDLERAAGEAHAALRPGGGAAFADEDEDGRERAVLVHEVRRPGGWSADEVGGAIARAVLEREGVALDLVLLIPPGALPKTTSGKVRRRRARALWREGALGELARWERARPPADGAPAARTPEAVADWLAARVASALACAPETVARAAPLGALGVDSLAMTEIARALHAALGAAPGLSRLLEGASIEALAREACALAAAAARPAPAAPAFDPTALTHGERSLWLLHRLAPDDPAYNLAGAFLVRSPTAPDELARALEALVRRHAALRTTFEEGPGGEPRRRVHAAQPLDFARRDARGLALDLLLARAREEACAPFDLARGPLLRARWYERDGEPPVCLLAAHHVALDHASFATLLEELALLHDGREPALVPDPDAPRRAEQAALASGAWDADLAWWRARLAAPPEPLALGERPSAPAGAATARAGVTRTRVVGARTSAALAACAAAHGTTPFVVALAAFEALLHRASGRRDFLLATLSAGRAAPEAAEHVGYLVNPVVLRADLSGAPSFETLLARARRDAAGALAHAALPFARLVEALHPERDPHGTPLVQALFAWQNPLRRRGADLTPLALGLGGARLALGGLVLETLALEPPGAQFDLSLSAGLVDGRLALALECDRARFDAAGAERLLERYERLLAAALARPAAPLRALDLASDAERGQLRALAAGPPLPEDAREPVIAGFARAARAHAARVALESEARAWSYAELARAVCALARALAAQGVGPGTLVALSVPRSPELAALVLAVCARGATWMPIDPALPPARRAALEREAERVLRAPDLDALLGDAPDADAACDELLAAARGVLPLAPAYRLHTSGSTGTPKAVLVPHAALAIHARAAREAYGLVPADRVLHMAATGFDLSIEELLPPLLCGARVFVWQAPAPPSVAELEELVLARGLSVLDLPTVYWHEWMRVAAEEGRPLCAGLRLVIVGGERASAAALATWRALAPAGTRWVNTYGPTEATVTTTLFEPEPGETLASVPIGRPLAGQRVVVLDACGWPAAPGEAGELGIGGACLALGYAGLAARTAQAFVPDPLADAPGARLYRSGDRVRLDERGRLAFLGRLDEQVKVRGVRVEPGEVEACLAAHPGVAEACVLARAAHGGTRLAAWVVPRASGLEPEALRAFVAERLPAACVPADVRLADALPRNAHGKRDRARLVAALEAEEREGLREALLRPAGAPADAERRAASEQALAALLGELLGRAPGSIGRDDDFFALGGDSILSIQLAARAARAGLELTPAEVFRHRTLAALARAARPLRARERTSLDGPLALTPIQRWLLAQELERPWHWNLSVWIELGADPAARAASGAPAAPDAERVRRALARLVDRHDALRLAFARDAAGWHARVRPAGLGPPCAEHALASEAQAEELAAALQGSLDLERGAPLAAALVRTPARVRLLLVAHHLVVDAVSWHVLADELAQLLAGLELPAPPLPWSRHAGPRAQAVVAAALAADDAERWSAWLARLRAVPPLPRDGDGPDLAGEEATLHAALGREETDALRAAGARAHASLEELAGAALAGALAAWSGATTVALELEGHGRALADEDAAERARTVGWFTELQPLVLDVPPGATPPELLRAFKRELAQVPGGRGAWFRARHGADAALAARVAAPAPEVALNFLGELAPRPGRARLCEELPAAQRAPCARRTHALELDLWLAGGRLALRWTWARTRHARGTIERLDALVRDGLARLAHGADAAALGGADFPLARLSDDELASVLTRLARP